MYHLGFCYPYNSNIFWDGRDTELNNHWITIITFKYDEIKEEDGSLSFSSGLYDSYLNFYNYNNSNIVTNPQIIKLYKIDNTCLCVIKTIWLKIFQRKYKNYYNKKINYYKNPKNIIKRQITGKYF